MDFAAIVQPGPLLRGARPVAGLLLLLFTQASVRPAPVLQPAPDFRSGTYFERIREVQDRRIAPVRQGKANISIPYTRIDVAVENGIAFYRLLQVYHNHGSTNQGFAFRLNIPPEMAIREFAIWDRGKRYAGVIEDRRKAEAVYKKVTGDEAPRMNKDPGLVRRTAGTFEMRVFPIFPGENKQIELRMTERVSPGVGSFLLAPAIKELINPNDARHGSLMSHRTDVSVYVRDELPVQLIRAGTGLRLKHQSPNVLLLGGRFADAVPPLEVEYRLKMEQPAHALTQTYRGPKTNSFSMRILFRVPPAVTSSPDSQTDPPSGSTAAGKPTVPKASGKTNKSVPGMTPADTEHIYVGVWRHPQAKVTTEALLVGIARELRGYRTLFYLDRKQYFMGAWRPPQFGEEVRKDLLVPSRLYPIAEAGRALNEVMTELKRTDAGQKNDGSTKGEPINEAKAGQPTFRSPLEHLSHVLGSGKVRGVLLFIETLPPTEVAQLRRIIADHPQQPFILYLDGADDSAVFGNAANLSMYSDGKSWQRIGTGLETTTVLPLTGEGDRMQNLFNTLSGTNGLELRRFWSRLPFRDPGFPALEIKPGGAVKLQDASRLSSQGNRGWFRMKGSAGNPPADLAVEWIAGTFTGSGSLNFSLNTRFPAKSRSRVRLPFEGQNNGPVVRAQARADFGTSSVGAEFAGMFNARIEAEALDFRRSYLDALILQLRERKVQHDRQAELETERDQLRARLVTLATRHQFITSETAFIALPERMRIKYKIGAQNYHAGGTSQSPFNAGPGMSKGGGVPEPAEWLALLLIGCLGAAIIVVYRRRRFVAQD